MKTHKGSYTPLTSALQDGWLTPRPSRFTPWEVTRYPLFGKTGEAPGLVWTGEELLARDTIQSPARPVR